MRIIGLFCLVWTCVAPLSARPIAGFLPQKLFDAADLVVVAEAIANRDTSDPFVFPVGVGGSTDGILGVDTDLAIDGIFKGDRSLHKIVFHHYRMEDGHDFPVNGPTFAQFHVSPTRVQRTLYLFFLKRDTDGRYIPVTDQLDPYGRDVVEFTGVSPD